MYFFNTYTITTQEFNCKIKVVPMNLEINMGMNVSTHLTLWMNDFFFHLRYG
jgi:hypothetical protein